MHRWLANELSEADRRRGYRIALLGPRGAAKSTLATLFHPLRAVCEGREPYTWLVSDTKTQAETHLNNIRIELENNEELHREYGRHQLRRQGLWASNKIQLANGCIIEAYGTGQKLRGRRRGAQRPSLMICDDIQNDSHIYSAGARDTSRDWFYSSLLKAGNEKTNVVNVGTALHRAAIAVELMDRPGWSSRVFSAIVDWPKRRDLWKEWESLYTDTTDPHAAHTAASFYRQHKAEMDDGARVLWPEHEPLEMLMKMRAEDGHQAFEREKQNSPIDPDRCEWPVDYWEAIFETGELPPIVESVLVLDPALGKARRTNSDYSCWLWLGVDTAGIVHCDAWLTRNATEAVIEQGIRLAQQLKPDQIGIETVAFQHLVAGEWQRRAQAAGVYTFPALIENKIPKEIRIRRLGPVFSARRIRFRSESPGARMVIEQLRDWPLSDHDDGPDALEMGFRLLGSARPSGGGPSRVPLETT